MSHSQRNPLGEMPFLDHLEELRWRIFYMLIALIVGTILGFLLVYYLGVMEILVRPVRPFLSGEGLAYFNPATPFYVTMKLSLAVGIILALPVIVYQIWAFLSPGLKSDEKRVIVPALYFGLVLFCAGVALAYFFVLPLALVFLTGFQQEFLEPTIEVGSYLGFVTRMLLAFGIVFELPIVVLILSVLGLVTPAFMRQQRRYAIVVITILSSLLTPGDLASTFMMMAPMMFLYEASIFVSAMVERRRQRRLEDEEPSILEAPQEPPPGAVGAEGP